MTNKAQLQPDSIASLRKQWNAVTILSIAGLLLGSILLYSSWRPVFALRWLLLALLGCIYLLGHLRDDLSKNHRIGEAHVLPTFGAGNALTIFRGILLAFLFGFIISPRPTGWLAWLPAALYTLAAIIDLFDGYFARVAHHATRLGETLDLKLDGLGVLIAAVLAVRYGQVPAWYLSVGLARYLFVAGIRLRERAGQPVYELSESARRRPFAGAQMGFLAAVLWPVFSPPGTHLAAVLFALPFLVGFVWDWLVVSGAIKPAVSQPTSELSPDAERVTPLRRQYLAWLPLILRASVLAMVMIALVRRLPGYAQEVDLTSSYFAITTNWNIILVLFLLISGTLLLSVGAAGRTASLAVMISVGLHQHISALGDLDYLLLIAAAALFFLGTGNYSLWQPEERLIRKRLGEV